MTETFATDNRIVQGVSLVFLFAATVSMVLLLGHSYLRRRQLLAALAMLTTLILGSAGAFAYSGEAWLQGLDPHPSTTVPTPTAPVGSGAPTEQKPSPQDEVQAKFDVARRALRVGSASAPLADRVRLGDTYTLRVRVCGPYSSDCGAATSVTAAGSAPSPPESRPPPVQQTPLAVGARIGASVTYATDAKITPEPEDVQYIGAYDSVAWEWNVKPATAGSEFITIRFRVLYGETDQALVGNTYLKVPLTVEKTAGAMLRDTAAAIGGGLVGLAGMATALGVTGGGALAYFRRLRRRRTKARESWERKRDRQRQARALLRGNSMSRDPLRIYRRPG